MKVEIWSDVVCPWCYIGKRRFEAALAGFGHRDEVEVMWRSFELDPEAPRVSHVDPVEHLATKYSMPVEQARAAQANVTAVAAGEGLDYHLATAKGGNSFDAHRLVHLAADEGRQEAMEERLFAAHFVDNEAIGDHETLARLAAEIGLDGEEAREVLAGDAFGDEVRSDEAEARALGISGVPFFVIDRAYGVSGAQPSETLRAALDQAWTASHPLTMVQGEDDGPSCEGDNCAI